METSQSTQPASRETCLGLSLVEERSISEEERAALQREARQSLGRSCAWGCLAPLAFLIFICVMASVFPSSNNASASTLSVIFMVLGLAAVAAFFLLANDRYGLRKIAKQDLRNGNIKRYQSFAPGIDKDNLPETNVPPEPTGKIAGVDVSAYEPIILEVFRESRRLWQVNETRVEQLAYAPEEHTTIQPKHAQIAAKWVEPAQITGEHIIDISQSGQRNLSPQEVEEIHRRSKSAWRRPAYTAITLMLYVLGFVAIERLAKSYTHFGWAGYLFVIVTVWMNVKFVKIARWSWRLSKDAKRGTTIITRYPDQIEDGKVLQKGAIVEWLPYSNSQWNIDGEPAPWRLRG